MWEKIIDMLLAFALTGLLYFWLRRLVHDHRVHVPPDWAVYFNRIANQADLAASFDAFERALLDHPHLNVDIIYGFQRFFNARYERDVALSETQDA